MQINREITKLAVEYRTFVKHWILLSITKMKPKPENQKLLTYTTFDILLALLRVVFCISKAQKTTLEIPNHTIIPKHTTDVVYRRSFSLIWNSGSTLDEIFKGLVLKIPPWCPEKDMKFVFIQRHRGYSCFPTRLRMSGKVDI